MDNNNNNICWLSNWSPSMNEWMNELIPKKMESKREWKNQHFIDEIGTHQYFMIISHHNRYSSTSQSTETPINLIRKKVIIIIPSNYCSSIKCIADTFVSVQSIGIFFITLQSVRIHIARMVYVCGKFQEFYWPWYVVDVVGTGTGAAAQCSTTSRYYYCCADDKKWKEEIYTWVIYWPK